MVDQQTRKAWQRKHRKSWNKSPVHMTILKTRKAKKEAKKKQEEKYNRGVKQ